MLTTRWSARALATNAKATAFGTRGVLPVPACLPVCCLFAASLCFALLSVPYPTAPCLATCVTELSTPQLLPLRSTLPHLTGRHPDGHADLLYWSPAHADGAPSSRRHISTAGIAIPPQRAQRVRGATAPTLDRESQQRPCRYALPPSLPSPPSPPLPPLPSPPTHAHRVRTPRRFRERS